MLVPLAGATRDPTQSAKSGAPVQMLMLTSVAATASPSLFKRAAGGLSVAGSMACTLTE